MPLSYKIRVRRFSTALCGVAALVSAVHSQTVSDQNPVSLPATRVPTFVYGVDAGIGESDNVTLAPTDKISQTIAITDVDFALNERSRLLVATAAGDFSYLDYLQNAFGRQLIGRFDGSANLSIIPQRLTWSVRDDFGQAAIDAFTPMTPNNLEDINYFSTGPDFKMRFGGVNFIDVSARYGRSQYQKSPFDSNRLLGSVSVGRDISAGADVSLNANTEHVMFANTEVNTNFERTSGFARYELHGARTDLEGDLGATTINPTTGNSTTGGLAKILLARKISHAATLTFSVGRELTDASSSFSSLQSGAIGVVGTAGAVQTSSPYTSDFASAEWKYHRNRTSLALSARWEKDSYNNQPFYNVSRPGFEFNIERRLTRGFTAQVLGRYYKSDYPNVVISPQAGSSDYEDALVGIAFVWRHGRGLEIRLRCDHDYHGVATGSLGYHENRAFLTVGYRPTRAAVSEEVE